MLSGRTNDELAAGGEVRADHAERARVASERKRASPDLARVPGARKGILPPFVEPCLATLAADAPVGGEWVHEIKFDGYRLQARIDGGKVKLLTRKGLDWTAKFARVAEALKGLKLGAALIDGEVVVEDEGGVSSFTGLQEELKSERSDRMIYLCLRPALPRRLQARRRAADRAQDATRRPARRRAGRRRDPLQRSYRDRWRNDAPARLPARARGHHLEAPRPALPSGPPRRLAQGEVHRAAGIRHRRVRALDDRREGDRLARACRQRGRQARPCRARRHRLHRGDGAPAVGGAR